MKNQQEVPNQLHIEDLKNQQEKQRQRHLVKTKKSKEIEQNQTKNKKSYSRSLQKIEAHFSNMLQSCEVSLSKVQEKLTHLKQSYSFHKSALQKIERQMALYVTSMRERSIEQEELSGQSLSQEILWSKSQQKVLKVFKKKLITKARRYREIMSFRKLIRGQQ